LFVLLSKNSISHELRKLWAYVNKVCSAVINGCLDGLHIFWRLNQCESTGDGLALNQLALTRNGLWYFIFYTIGLGPPYLHTLAMLMTSK